MKNGGTDYFTAIPGINSAYAGPNILGTRLDPAEISDKTQNHEFSASFRPEICTMTTPKTVLPSYKGEHWCSQC